MTRVMVTAVGGGGVGEQILKALRLAGEDYYLVGADMQPASKGLYEVDKAVVLPPASAEGYVQQVLETCAEEHIDALFPGSEPEIKVLGRQVRRFKEAGVFLPLNPPEILDLCFDKLATMAWLEKNGFAAPKTVLVTSLYDLDAFDEYPVVLKPHLSSGGSANVFLAQSRDEMILFATYLLTLYDAFIAQAYVGTPEEEYTVGVLFDMDGALINSIAVKKNIMTGLSNKIKVPNNTGRAELGPVLAISSGVSQGHIGRYADITAQCEEIGLKMGCQGAINVQCRVVQGKVMVFEINPRLSGTTSLRAMAGYNEPDVLMKKHLRGQPPVVHFPYRQGNIMRGLSELFVET